MEAINTVVYYLSMKTIKIKFSYFYYKYLIYKKKSKIIFFNRILFFKVLKL